MRNQTAVLTALALATALAGPTFAQTQPGSPPAATTPDTIAPSTTAPSTTAPSSTTTQTAPSTTSPSTTTTTTTQTPSTTTTPSTTPSTTTVTTPSPAGQTFVTSDNPNQWLASRLIGTTVYGPDNAKIGEIDDILVDQSGRVIAAVVGVGGFLGIGEKHVAIAFDRIKPEQRDGRERVTVSLTKNDLQQAPEFKRQNRRG